jgi:hypothetical protein
VDEHNWIFGRNDQRLEIGRTDVANGVLLSVTGDGSPRSFFFSDVMALVTFQSDMEAFLLKTGWTFLEFVPDRRAGRDRRGWPRITERRRWWTDGPGRQSLPSARRRRRRNPRR